MYISSNQVPKFNTYLLLPGGLNPRLDDPLSLTIANPLSWLEGPRGSGHPDPDFRSAVPQHNQQPCNRSTSRRNIPCHGVHDSSR
jgi:hypothetical protein